MPQDLKLLPLPVPEWDPSLQKVLEDMKGRPLNVHSLMANHPELLKAWWDFRNYSVRGGDLSQRQCELVILRVACHMQAEYEWLSHVDRGFKAGLSLIEIERIKLGPSDPGWSEDDSLLLRAVDECIEQRAIAQPTLQKLRQHFSNKQVVDIIAIHGMYVILGVMINTWGLELDDFIELPEGYGAGR